MGFAVGCGRGWTLGLTAGFGGTGLGGGGVGVDSTATGAATGAGSALINCAVIERASTGRGFGSLRIVVTTATSAT
jgi:hypothetical protein